MAKKDAILGTRWYLSFIFFSFIFGAIPCAQADVPRSTPSKRTSLKIAGGTILVVSGGVLALYCTKKAAECLDELDDMVIMREFNPERKENLRTHKLFYERLSIPAMLAVLVGTGSVVWGGIEIYKQAEKE